MTQIFTSFISRLSGAPSTIRMKVILGMSVFTLTIGKTFAESLISSNMMAELSADFGMPEMKQKLMQMVASSNTVVIAVMVGKRKSIIISTSRPCNVSLVECRFSAKRSIAHTFIIKMK